jgi:hypothetical protein
VYIRLADYYHAGTDANLWMNVKQGSTSCDTKRPTWQGPDSGKGWYYETPYGCRVLFDERKKVHLWLYSSGNNDVYVNAMGVRVGSEYKTWYSGEDYVAIDHDTNNGYWITSS